MVEKMHDVSGVNFLYTAYTWTDIDFFFFRWALFQVLKIRFASGLRSLQYKAEPLGWSGSLLLQTEAALIADYGREQTDYRYVLYMTPLQKTRTIPLKLF